MYAIFYENSYIFAVSQLSWHKILFFTINWSQVDFFFFIDINFILARTYIRKHQIFSGLLILLMYSKYSQYFYYENQ